MITIIVIWTVGFFFANMLQCYPISVNWTGLGGNGDACIDENMMYLGQAFSDAITDLIILVMPIPWVGFRIPFSLEPRSLLPRFGHFSCHQNKKSA